MYATAKAIDWPLVTYPQTASVVAGLGLLVAVLGVWQFRKAKTTVDPRKPGRVRRSLLVVFIAGAATLCISAFSWS